MATTTRTVTIKLSPDDLKEAVSAWAKSKGLVDSAYDCTVAINVTRRTTGYGMAERDEHVGEVVLTQGGAP